jgi:Nitrile hydratase, alpha chain
MAQTEQDKARAAYGKVIAKAWRDPAFKAKLLADPHATLTAAGVALPAGLTVRVVENTDKEFHFVLPPKPTGELSDEALDNVSAGVTPVPAASNNWMCASNNWMCAFPAPTALPPAPMPPMPTSMSGLSAMSSTSPSGG